MSGRISRCRLVFVVSVLLLLLIGDLGYGATAGVVSGTGALDVAAVTRELAAKFPGSEAVIIYDSLIVTLMDDGSIRRRTHRRVALFTDDAIRRYGDPRVLFDADRQMLDIEVARVYMRDGTPVDTEENGKNQTTPFSIAKAPDYTSWQEMVITHVGIEKGCIAELCYTIADKERIFDALSGFFIFNEDDPVVERVLVINLPPGAKLKHLELNGASAPVVSQDGGRFTWSMTDLPCRRGGGGFAWYGDYLPVVYYSTVENRDDIASRVAAWFGEAIETCDFSKELIGDEAAEMSNTDLLMYLQKKAVGAVRGIDVPFDMVSFKPRRADRVFQSGYGHIFDRAVLLGSLLSEEGFQPYPVLVSRGNTFPEDIPVADIFNRVLVAVPLDNRVVILDPEKTFERDPSLLSYGKMFLHCTVPSGLEKAGDELNADINVDRLSLKVSFDGSDIVCKGSAEMGGIFSPYWIIRGTDGELKRYLEKRLGSIFSRPELIEWNVVKLEPGSVEVGFSFKAESILPMDGERAYIDLPAPFESSLGGLEAVDLAVSSVKAPFYVVPCNLSVDIEFAAPEGWRFAAFPEETEAENRLGGLRISVTSIDGGGSRVTRDLVIRTDRVAPESYPDYRRMVLSFMECKVVLSRE